MTSATGKMTLPNVNVIVKNSPLEIEFSGYYGIDEVTQKMPVSRIDYQTIVNEKRINASISLISRNDRNSPLLVDNIGFTHRYRKSLPTDCQRSGSNKCLIKSPNLPDARVLWDARYNLDIAATTWIRAGGAHHTVYSQAVTNEFMEDFAEIAGIELLFIDEQTRVRDSKDKLHANEAYYNLFQHGM